jgi:sugar phosphate isomerase/epimerase
VDIAARAGYHAIEPWIDELERLKKTGGSLKDVGKRIRDRGLVVESSIGFCEWIVDDAARRKKGLENARRSMDLVQQIGGKRMAAPPVGAVEQSDLNLLKAAERYRALLDLGVKMGVIPQAEVWGFSKTLTRLGDTALVAIESGHPQACILADVYHLYKGGSTFEGLRLLGSPALQVFHMNDYPSSPSRARITDAYRVYPGDGIAPLKGVLRDLHHMGFKGILSLELFNPTYWKQDAFTVAQTGLKKMRALAQSSLE